MEFWEFWNIFYDLFIVMRSSHFSISIISVAETWPELWNKWNFGIFNYLSQNNSAGIIGIFGISGISGISKISVAETWPE